MLMKQKIQNRRKQECHRTEQKKAQGENEIFSGTPIGDINLIGNQIGQRAEKTPEAPGIHTPEQCPPVPGEIRKEQSGGNITDKLTHQSRKQKNMPMPSQSTFEKRFEIIRDTEKKVETDQK
jgi:hypothetical protein